MSTLPLADLKILILEDEFLIAMDIEQVCRDQGAAEVYISRTLDELGPEPLQAFDFDAAVVDMRLGGTSTLDFALDLMEAGVPFVFATGYADPTETSERFPGIPLVTKPYNGPDLVEALSTAVRSSPHRQTVALRT